MSTYRLGWTPGAKNALTLEAAASPTTTAIPFIFAYPPLLLTVVAVMCGRPNAVLAMSHMQMATDDGVPTAPPSPCRCLHDLLSPV